MEKKKEKRNLWLVEAISQKTKGRHKEILQSSISSKKSNRKKITYTDRVGTFRY